MTGKPKKPNQVSPLWGGPRTPTGRPKKANPASLRLSFRLTEDEAQRLAEHALPGEPLATTARRLALVVCDGKQEQPGLSQNAIVLQEQSTTYTPNDICRRCQRPYNRDHIRPLPPVCPVCHEPLP